MWETQHNNADKVCFKTLILQETFEDSTSTSGGILFLFGSHTFVPISWMCKKQTSVPYSSTGAEIISLDAGLRMDGIPALGLWASVIEIYHSSPNKTNKTKDVKVQRRKLTANIQLNMRSHIQTKHIDLSPLKEIVS